MVSTVLTEVAMDHFMVPSAMLIRAGYKTRSRGRDEIAHPRAQTTENRVNDAS